MAEPLLPLRTAVILGAALLVAVGTATLTYIGNRKLPKSLIAGATAGAAAVIWCNTIIAA